jgi:antitoxin VapB
MATGTIFTNNRTQAVRLPAEVRFPDGVKRVEVVALGRSRLLVPADQSWDVWFDGEGVSDDFMTERNQPPPQIQDTL